MQDIRQRLIEVFRDTQAFYEDDPRLSEAVAEGVKNARFYAADDYPALPEKRKTPVIITVTKNKTFQAAIERHFRHTAFEIPLTIRRKIIPTQKIMLEPISINLGHILGYKTCNGWNQPKQFFSDF